jgi:hypothetical protein
MQEGNINFPKSVRYVKNSRGGQWWQAARANNQIHLGRKSVPHKFLLMPDFPKIKQLLKVEYESRQGHLGGKFARIFITATDKSGEAASAFMDPSAVPCQIGSLPCAP